MRVALIYPPSADPTAPYLAVPVLGAVLRQAGHEVLPVDANAEAYRWLLRREPLQVLAERVVERLRALDQKPTLTHLEQRELVALWRARGDATVVPGAIDAALAVLDGRAGAAFYDVTAYDRAVRRVQGALRLVSAAHHPLDLDFAWYRTPFALLDPDAIAADAAPGRDPFAGYLDTVLLPRLHAARPDWVGVSVAFVSQLQPAYALALALRRVLPATPLVVGGPALSQLMLRLAPALQAQALGPYDLAVAGEGASAVRQVCEALGAGRSVASLGPVLRGEPDDLQDLPAPDFDGLDLAAYLSPEPVLPYDPSRGCYWGRCAFCHYGPVREGTGRYRERPLARIVDDLDALSRKHGARLFYLSQDSIAPKTLLAVARALHARGSPLRWGSDLRPERYFTEERSQQLVQGGALALSLGIESGSPRVLERIDKGLTVDDVERVVPALAGAGIAVELMSFTGFPGETLADARRTLRLIQQLRPHTALFICGEFSLDAGSRVACQPEVYGIREVWRLDGDLLASGLFYTPSTSLEARAQLALDAELDALAAHWTLRRYPWAGALSTAHSLLWYLQHGPEVFKRLHPPPPRPRWQHAATRHAVLQLEALSAQREHAIWARLIHEERHVSAQRYRELIAAIPAEPARPGQLRFAEGGQLEPGGRPRARSRSPRRRRR